MNYTKTLYKNNIQDNKNRETNQAIKSQNFNASKIYSSIIYFSQKLKFFFYYNFKIKEMF